MSRTKYEGFQNKLIQIAPESCFFLTLLSIADDFNTDYKTGKATDLVDALNKSLKEGWLGAKDNLMYGDTKLLSWLTGKPVVKRVVDGDRFDGETVLDNEYTATKWRRGKATHFRRRGYDVYDNSQIVAKGKLESVYIYRIG